MAIILIFSLIGVLLGIVLEVFFNYNNIATKCFVASFFLGWVLFLPSCIYLNVNSEIERTKETKYELASMQDHIETAGTFLTVTTQGRYIAYVKAGKNRYRMKKFSPNRYTIVESDKVKPSVVNVEPKYENKIWDRLMFPLIFPDENLIYVPPNSVSSEFNLDAQ